MLATKAEKLLVEPPGRAEDGGVQNREKLVKYCNECGIVLAMCW